MNCGMSTRSIPALGLRAIRWSLSEPAMFRQQLRAILRASAFGKVRVLIPMVAHRSEIRQRWTRWSVHVSNCRTQAFPSAMSNSAP
jgi:phosphoenolpyruvate-protein kinase (PTS system EI component)